MTVTFFYTFSTAPYCHSDGIRPLYDALEHNFPRIVDGFRQNDNGAWDYPNPHRTEILKKIRENQPSTSEIRVAKIRPLYDEHGAEGYYRAFADSYENPHFPEIKALIERNFARFDCSSVLDFAAGGGEVTQALQVLQVQNIIGCDPFTFGLYEKNTSRPCLQLSFKDVIKNGLPGHYSLIISSFALHLCPVSDLFSLTWQLLDAAPLLVVLTPHKRPELEKLQGIELVWEDSVETERGKKVRLKAYRRSQY